MRVKLAVRPKIETVPQCGRYHYYPHWDGYPFNRAMRWLGARYLCHKPIKKRKIENEK
jgi:hypothetical protein